ncbi:MAG: sulfite exporter TauE/SafE family protein [Pseudomonadales bacterium]|nr:sulfite exporter TauE/SafE family protein [Pseudomonadales bacterium]
MPKHIGKLFRHPSVILGLCVWTAWIAYMSAMNTWHLFDDYAFISLTMAFASFIAGATSEGGGAVAFPVLTIFFDIDPAIARDFSLAIQSVGMSAAALAIFVSKIPVEKKALFYATLGGIPGALLGLYGIAPYMSPVYTKMFFVSLWLSFGVVIAYRHLFSTKALNKEIRNYSFSVKRQLVILGLIGGAVTGITGSGIDIVVFSYLVLQHRVDIRIATPTSVVLMAGNALIAISMRLLGSQPIEAITWDYWLVSIPIVVIGAPLGAKFIATRSNQFVAGLLCTIIIAQFVGALLIVPQSIESVTLTGITFALGFILFSGFVHKTIARRKSDQIPRG